MLFRSLQKWLPETGDCRQELVFIGQHINFDVLKDELNACLLSDEEMALGSNGWQLLNDPFGECQEEVAV